MIPRPAASPLRTPVLWAALLVGALAIATAAAGAARLGALKVSGPEVRASLGVNPNTAGYLVIENAGTQADALVGAFCACAREVQLHLMTTRDGIMKMERADSLAIPAGGRLALRPGGAHLMILGVKQPLKAGTEVPMTLTFRRAGKVTTAFHVVVRPTAAEDHSGHKGH